MAVLGSELQVGSMSGPQVPHPPWTGSCLRHDLLMAMAQAQEGQRDPCVDF